MGYLLAFGVILVGYTLLDWGHYVVKHEKVSLWYLISGQGSPTSSSSSGTSSGNGLPQNTTPGGAVNPFSPGSTGGTPIGVK